MSAITGRSVELWLLGPWPSPRDLARAARRHEDNGWDGMVLADAQNLGPDPFVSLGIAATATSKLKLGTGVTNPVTRAAAVMATAMITVQAVSGGRAVLGIGRGDGALVPLGLRPASVAEFEGYLDQLQAYLRGDSVPLNGTDSRLVYLDTDPVPKVPVDVAATGPRMLRLAATKADIVSCAVGALTDRARYCRDVIRTARLEAGLDPDAITLSCYVPVAVTGALSRHEARDVIRASASIFARFSAMEGKVIEGVTNGEEPFLARMASRYQGPAGHPTFAAASVIEDDEFIDRFAIIGTPAECAERLQALISLGFTRIIMITRSFGSDPDDVMSARVAQEVFPLLDLQ
jgi:5,10-methylenetetrahydromethanopterin reductase